MVYGGIWFLGKIRLGFGSGKVRLGFGSGQSEVRFVWTMVSFRYDSSWR